MILLELHCANRARLTRAIALARAASASRVFWAACLALAVGASAVGAADDGNRAAVEAAGEPPVFTASADGRYPFDTGVLLLGDRALGHWQVSARDAAAVALIRDGRWKAKPSPVDWAVLPPLAAPIALRRDRQTDLATGMMAPKADCFAAFMPFAGETHYSLYLSLFGHDVHAGEQDHASARLLVGAGLSDADVVQHYRHYEIKR